MTTEQAYAEGFVKRASEYGFSEAEAECLLKEATRWTDELRAGNIGLRPSGVDLTTPQMVVYPPAFAPKGVNFLRGKSTKRFEGFGEHGTHQMPEFQKVQDLEKSIKTLFDRREQIPDDHHSYDYINKITGNAPLERTDAQKMIIADRDAIRARLGDQITKLEDEKYAIKRRDPKYQQGAAHDSGLREMREYLRDPSKIEEGLQLNEPKGLSRKDMIAKKVKEMNLRRWNAKYTAPAPSKGMLSKLKALFSKA